MRKHNAADSTLERTLVRQFISAGRPLSADALEELTDHLSELNVDESEHRLKEILHELTEKQVGECPTVTSEDLASVFDNLLNIQQDDLIQIVDAFKMPRFEWDESHKRFVKFNKTLSLHTEPLAKPLVIIDRLKMIQQCCHRISSKTGRVLNTSSEPKLQITPIKALVGSAGRTRTIMGVLKRDSRGQVSLEDATGTVRLTNFLEQDIKDVFGFVSHGCCMILQGMQLPNQDFKVSKLKEPPMESREAAVQSLRGLSFNGAKALRPSVMAALKAREFRDESQRLVFLSHCYLDDPVVLQSLAAIFHGYDGLSEGPPALFVLIGPFFKGQKTGQTTKLPLNEIQAAFYALAMAIGMFPAIKCVQHSLSTSKTSSFNRMPHLLSSCMTLFLDILSGAHMWTEDFV